MARRPSKILVFLLISVSVFLFILSREHLQQSISWKAVSKNLRSREKGSLFDNYAVPQQEKGNWTPPSVVFSTSHKAKFANTTQRSSETKLKNDLITTSPQAETPIPIIFHKSFNKLPQWDFEDVYNEDAPPRLTNCAPSLRNSKDEAFQKDFLPNIRLFLYKDNIDMREWNRLSHFNSPFGFMELKYDDVMASVKLIPKPKEPLLPPKPTGNGCVHCAVVGTAGILNGSKLGAEIDAHDYVFRMNGAIIEGFEEDIGNRTSVYVHTAHSITASPFFFQKYGYTSVPHDEGIKYVLIPEGMRDFQWLEGLLKGERISAGKYANKEPRTYYSGQYNESRFYVLHQDFLRYVRNRFLRSSNLNTTYWPIVRPTNGAFTLFLALHTCDIVSAYGFITEDYNKYSNYYFQKHIKSDLIFYINHDYILEKDLWKSLHDRKIINLYQRTGPQEETEKLKESWYST